jgi:hypothetical protein
MAQITLTELSKRFAINRTTIYRAVSNGKISRLDNGKFDLSEVLRVFGEPPALVQHDAPQQNEQSKLVEVLERELLFLKNQIEQKDKQINSLQLLLGTSTQRPESTQSNDAPQRAETSDIQDIQQNETLQETISSVAKRHNDTPPETPNLIGRLRRGLKAFLK